MNQNQTGNFISQLRKEKGITQKELAEQIGVSDKAVSKWETGKGMPDISIFESLCRTLGVSVNELISGERIPLDKSANKMEETIMELVKENQKNKSAWGSIVIGAILLVVGTLALILFTSGFGGFAFLNGLLDIPTLILLLLFSFGAAFVSGARGIKEFVRVIRKVILPFGAVISIFSLIVLMYMMTDLATLGPNIAVAMLTLFYTFIIYIVLTIVENRFKQK